MIKKIMIEIIPHASQRYNTVGDWKFKTVEDSEDSETLEIKISNTQNSAANTLLIVHELVEALLCHARGIEGEDVDLFDMTWTPKQHYSGAMITEPGDDPQSPYHAAHQVASVIERILCERLYESWFNYERILNDLMKMGEKKIAPDFDDIPF